MTRTPSRTRTRTTRSSEHAAHRPLMHSVHIALWLKIASCVSSHPCMRTCGWCLELSVFFLVFLVFYLVSLFLFQPFLMSTSALNERSISNTLCDSSLGSVVTSDYVTPLTRIEPFFFWLWLKELNLFFCWILTQRIELFFFWILTQRIEPFFLDMTLRLILLSWILTQIKNWTFFSKMTQRIKLSLRIVSQSFFFLKKWLEEMIFQLTPKSNFLKWLEFFNMTRRIEPFFNMTQRIELFLKIIWLQEVKLFWLGRWNFFFNWNQRIKRFFNYHSKIMDPFFEHDSLNWPLLIHDSQNYTWKTHRDWTLLFNTSQRKWLHF